VLFWESVSIDLVERKGELEKLITCEIVPKKKVMFKFPSGFEDTSEEGNRIWEDMMPCEFFTLHP
jgi:hypothetical protein